jgi:integrase
MARRLEEYAERRARAEEAARARKDAQENSFAAVAEQFIKLHVSQKLKPKPASYAARMIRDEMVKAWGTRPIVEIGKREVLDLVQGIAARAPIQANRVMQTARKLFGWAQKRGIIASNPVAGLDKPAKERSRDRVLTDQEVKAIWRAAETLGYPYGTVIRLLLLTGQRLGEVAKMRRADVDGDYWTISDPKNDHPHGIVPPPLAREVLAETPSLAGEYLLSATGGETPLNGWSKPKARLDKQIAEDDTPVAHWTFHDLRRTAASGMARLGVAPHVIEAVLNHRSGQVKGIARVYNRYGYREEVARALAVWADHVERLLGEKPAGNVVPMLAVG